ncbi:MAG TPA: zinc-ribbon domain-containing protein [Dehalococcoidia bacterium]
MRTVGVLLLILGIVGLLLNLIFRLPAQFNLVVVVLISVVCLVAVWGGGRLSQPKTEPVTQPAGKYEPVSPPPPAQWTQPAPGVICPKCGCQIMPGQQFCSGCGSSLVSYCARCGAAINSPSRFCGSCGFRLS